EPANGEAYALGEEIAYRITVTNDGNLTITDITVTDELTGDEWTIASLAPEGTQTFTATYVVTEADVLAGSVVNVATAKGTSPDPDEPDVPVVPGEDEEPIEPKNSHLTLTKTVTNAGSGEEGAFVTGDTIAYEIVATNDGNVSILNAVISDELTGDAWTVDSIAPGASVTFTATYTVTDADTAAGSVVNTVTATGADPEDETPVVVPGEIETPIQRVFTLTILYRYANGAEAAPTVTRTVTFNRYFNVPSPVIAGYVNNRPVVEGMMPSRNLTYVVLYAAQDNTIVIEDYETPLGLGNVSINVGECIE
ncbi:MAG: hypothetical protein IJ240_09295, partial [Clostridia bacterium]|nr:hypothetical protein [Clostridia bacterium]